VEYRPIADKSPFPIGGRARILSGILAGFDGIIEGFVHNDAEGTTRVRLRVCIGGRETVITLSSKAIKTWPPESTHS